jgi:acyl carrier protein
MTTLDEHRAEILRTLTGLIQEVIGEEWVRETPIGPETSFAHDLELESIEFVALSEKIQARYGQEVDFPAWLSGMELDQIIALRIGDLVEYIASCQSKT